MEPKRQQRQQQRNQGLIYSLLLLWLLAFWLGRAAGWL